MYDFAKGRTVYSTLCGVFYLLFVNLFLNAQSSDPNEGGHLQMEFDSVTVKTIHIIGNKKTKVNTIFRELDFSPGDRLSIERLPSILVENEKRLESTVLFTYAKFNISVWDISSSEIELELTVREGWYIYPNIVFELADRNFNVWWKEENLSLSRVNYGLRLDHFNLTGNKDRLKVKLHTGYTNKAELKYDLPYIWGDWGMGGEMFYSDVKEIAGTTIGNKLNFYKDEKESVIFKRRRLGLSLNRRKNAFRKEVLYLYYWHNSVKDNVIKELNPNFFLNGNTVQSYPELYYEWTYDKRLFPFYGEGGYLLQAGFQALGLGISDDVNLLHIFAGGSYTHSFSDKLISTSSVKFRWNVFNKGIPYANNQALGYGTNFVKGFELYVVDGTDYVLVKQAFSFRIFKNVYDYSKIMPVRAFKIMPVQLYLRFSFESGYVVDNIYQEGNPLANRWHSGFGPAADLILYQTFLFGFEFNFNDLGEEGFYLRFTMSF